jgi:hypothetical protein
MKAELKLDLHDSLGGSDHTYTRNAAAGHVGDYRRRWMTGCFGGCQR